MSRFQTKPYIDVLKDPRKRYRLRRKEKPLWKWKHPYNRLLTIIFIIVTAGLAITLTYSTPLYFLLLLPVSIGLLGGLLVIYGLKIKASLRNRTPQQFDEFISNSQNTQKCSKKLIRAVRYTLAVLCNIKPDVICITPDIIYMSDTPKSLGSILQVTSPPLGFEFVLGAASRVGVMLSEKQVDHISQRIYRTAGTVEDLIVILSEEFTLVEKEHIVGAMSGYNQQEENLPKTDSFSKANDIDLDELRELADTSLAKKYFSNCVQYLYKHPGEVITLVESKQLPYLPEFDNRETPSFFEVLSKIRALLKMGPLLHDTPEHQNMELMVDKKEVDLNVGICDGAEVAWVTLRVESVK